MTKKRKSKSSSKKNAGLSIGGIILIIIALCALFAGERVGLVDVDWDAVMSGEDLDQVVSTPKQDVVAVVPATGKWYSLYFSSPQYPDEKDTRVDSISQGLVEAINSAQSSLDIAIYELDLKNVGEAILAARDRGVTVRIVTDSDNIEELDTLIMLEEEGIPMVPDERSAIMHNKFAVIDNRAVWTGSYNFTPNGTYRNNNNAIFIQSPELAANYATEFKEMFVDGEFGPKSPANTPNPKIMLGDTLIETCFAPEDECAVQLVDLLSQAQNNIRFMAFSFTHDKIGQAVRDRAEAGVQVQGIFETRGSETEYSEYGLMRSQGLDVWQDGNPYTLHHKVFIIDDNTVVMGSYNFSKNADESNDENFLIIHNPEIATQFMAEFNRNLAQAQNRPN